MSLYSVGLDYGTSSVRALLVDINSGEEIAATTFDYPHGKDGVILSEWRAEPGAETSIPAIMRSGREKTLGSLVEIKAQRDHHITAGQIIAIGVDTTASTPIPLGFDARPLAAARPICEKPQRDGVVVEGITTAHAEAAEITAAAQGKSRPQFLGKCGGTYSGRNGFGRRFSTALKVGIPKSPMPAPDLG